MIIVGPLSSRVSLMRGENSKTINGGLVIESIDREIWFLSILKPHT